MPSRARERRAQRTEHDEGAANPDPGDDGGCNYGTKADGHRDQALEHPERTCHDLIVDESADQRENGYVHQRVGSADARQQDERRCSLRKRCDQRERSTPPGDPEREPTAQAPAADQQRHSERSDHSANANRCAQQAHTRVPELQQIDRRHHREDGRQPRVNACMAPVPINWPTPEVRTIAATPSTVRAHSPETGTAPGCLGGTS